MRTDYEYVDQATGLCISTTHPADEYLEGLTQTVEGMNAGKSIMAELLLMIQDEYVITEGGDITSMVAAIEKHRKESGYPVIPASDIAAIVSYLFSRGWIGVSKVVWD